MPSQVHGLPPHSTFGLPPSPRATRNNMPRLDTNFTRPRTAASPTTSSYSEKEPMMPFRDTRVRNADSMIFVNATIPLSPVSTNSDRSALEEREAPFEGLAPRKRNGLARLFCCFGREERARRRAQRFAEYEEVGTGGHWSEY